MDSLGKQGNEVGIPHQKFMFASFFGTLPETSTLDSLHSLPQF